ncbi:S8/S53 family peptidase [bacterium]|nr:S8/S53 family peptidase [bacterium]
MQSNSIKTLLRILALTFVAVTAVWLVQRGPTFSFITGGVTLSGNTPEVLGESQLVRHANPERRLEILVGLKVRDEADLDALLDNLQNPDSPQYQQFLSTDQFIARFAPATHDVDEAVRYLTSKGLKIKAVPKNRLMIHAEGTVSQLENAFNVTINEYSVDTIVKQSTVGQPNAPDSIAPKFYLSNDRDPVVPIHLKDVVQSVIGLNTFAQMESRIAHSKAPANLTQAKAKAQSQAHTPQDIATAYNFPNSNNQNVAAKVYSGKGVKVAIATAYGYDIKDIETYWKRHGIVRGGKLIDIPINGLSGKFEEETTLDLQLLSSQIPDADVLMYIAVDPSFVNFALTFNQVAVDNEASVMSVSWGLCERGTGWLMMKTENMVFKQLAAQGIALFVSSGDDGAYDCKIKSKGKEVPKWAVDYPSSNPRFTAVGGTSLSVQNGARTAEPAWSGSGGGVSDHWSRPSWQSGPGLPGGDKRASADVAMNADPYTGYSFYFQGNWSRIGGTSASAPSWAALWVLTVEASGKRVGSANPYVYRIGNSANYGNYFYDVTKGNNGAGHGAGFPGYPAGPKWDHPTGWGVPDGAALVEWIVKVSPSTPAAVGKKEPVKGSGKNP